MTYMQKQIIDFALTEIKNEEARIYNLPPCDIRAKAIDLIAQSIRELVTAEAESDRGRSIEKHMKNVRNLIAKIQKINLKQ